MVLVLKQHKRQWSTDNWPGIRFGYFSCVKKPGKIACDRIERRNHNKRPAKKSLIVDFPVNPQPSSHTHIRHSLRNLNIPLLQIVWVGAQKLTICQFAPFWSRHDIDSVLNLIILLTWYIYNINIMYWKVIYKKNIFENFKFCVFRIYSYVFILQAVNRIWKLR